MKPIGHVSKTSRAAGGGANKRCPLARRSRVATICSPGAQPRQVS